MSHGGISAYFKGLCNKHGEEMKVNEVPANEFIIAVAEELKKHKEIEAPKWINFVKSGAHNERRPDNPNDFWYMRCASILRKLYLKGNLGVNDLRRAYGGRKNRGSIKEKHVDAGGSIIRKAFQKLEKAGFVNKEKVGRTLSSKGMKMLDAVAKGYVKQEKDKVEKPAKVKKEIKHDGGDKRKSAGRGKKKEADGA